MNEIKIKNGIRTLNGSGKIDYDYVNDILYFRVEDREYSHSTELIGYVIDFDTENFIIGIQIFNASVYFKISKNLLKTVKDCSIQASVINGVMEVRLVFKLLFRNQIIEKYCIHETGHGLGLENEPPALTVGSKDILKENMIISLEPALYIEGFGGIIIESMTLITKDGAEHIIPLPANWE